MKFDGNRAIPRHQQKRIDLLHWIFRFTYTDSVVTGLLLDLKKSAAADTLAGLVSDGLLARIQGHGVVTWMFRLTPAGARFISEHLNEFDEGLQPQTNPGTIGTHLARHNLVAQRLAAELVAKSRNSAEVLAPRQILRAGFAVGHQDESRAAWKIPDAIVLYPIPEYEQEAHGRTHHVTAIEIQQSPEAHPSRAHKLWQYWTALRTGQITGLIYASTDPAIVAAYATQWRHDLVERVYLPGPHKWIRPENARRVDSENELLDEGEFRVLDHDPFGVGLYPRFKQTATAAADQGRRDAAAVQERDENPVEDELEDFDDDRDLPYSEPEYLDDYDDELDD
ncbi:MAG: hypothetical protein NTW01_00985 [Gammaproteobacteria bacterium]|nr:hypothetical protein [Gammaproteobacteria bacterium]